MVVTEKQAALNSGLILIIIAAVIYFSIPYFANILEASVGISNIQLIVAVFVAIFGIYYWIKALTIKEI